MPPFGPPKIEMMFFLTLSPLFPEKVPTRKWLDKNFSSSNIFCIFVPMLNALEKLPSSFFFGVGFRATNVFSLKKANYRRLNRKLRSFLLKIKEAKPIFNYQTSSSNRNIFTLHTKPVNDWYMNRISFKDQPVCLMPFENSSWKKVSQGRPIATDKFHLQWGQGTWAWSLLVPFQNGVMLFFREEEEKNVKIQSTTGSPMQFGTWEPPNACYCLAAWFENQGTENREKT